MTTTPVQIPNVAGREELFKALDDILSPEGHIKPHTMVMMENLGPRDFSGQQAMYDNTEFPIAVGETRLVPYYAMCMWCGDPRAVDHPTDVRIRHRTDEWKRLRMVYGAYDNAVDIANMLKFRVTTIAGTPLITVLDDPDGHEINQGNSKQANDLAAMQRGLDNMNEQVAKQQALIDALLKERNGVVNDGISPAAQTHVATAPAIIPEQAGGQTWSDSSDGLPVDSPQVIPNLPPPPAAAQSQQGNLAPQPPQRPARKA